MRYPHWKDRNGTPIEVGARVAYNMSGDVVPGEVVHIASGHAKIRLALTNGPRPAHISKVKRPGSILVLRRPA